MKVYAVDDEKYTLAPLTNAICEALPEAEVIGFRNPLDVLDASIEQPCDVAFLNVRMPGMSGIEVAKQLSARDANTNIVFVTGYDEYKNDAMDVHASDYVTKPVTPKKIKKAMANLRHPVSTPVHRFRAVTFGNFALYVDKKLVYLHGDDITALLAFLVHKNGTVVSREELALVLYNDESYVRDSQKKICRESTKLQKCLEQVGASDILYRGSDGLAVNREILDADLYEFYEGCTSLYRGQYMDQYSWGEEFKAANSPFSLS